MGTLVLLPIPKKIDEAQERSDARHLLAACVHVLQERLTTESAMHVINLLTEATDAVVTAHKAVNR